MSEYIDIQVIDYKVIFDKPFIYYEVDVMATYQGKTIKLKYGTGGADWFKDVVASLQKSQESSQPLSVAIDYRTLNNEVVAMEGMLIEEDDNE